MRIHVCSQILMIKPGGDTWAVYSVWVYSARADHFDALTGLVLNLLTLDQGSHHGQHSDLLRWHLEHS